MAVINGSDVYFYIQDPANPANKLPVGCAESLSINFEQDINETNCKDTGYWKEYFAGLKTYTIDVSGFVKLTNPFSLEEMFNAFNLTGASAELTWEIRLKDSIIQIGDFVLTGKVLMSSLGLDFNVNEAVKYSLSFQGTGECTLEEYA